MSSRETTVEQGMPLIFASPVSLHQDGIDWICGYTELSSAGRCVL